jgi:flavin reductase (DIM6/NTAB) family NADH-FMN oxidoreductase RutF
MFREATISMSTGLVFDFTAMAKGERYKLLTGIVVPRPIALITTVSRTGVINTAPYSFFNVFSEDPPTVVLGIDCRSDGSMKDSSLNARETGVFAVNLVDEALAISMNDCAVDFPPDTSEPAILGLPLGNGVHVPVPHLAAAPAVLECRKMMMINVGLTRDLLIGEVVGVLVRDGIVDPKTLRVDFNVYKPVGRLVGSLYARQHDRFALKRQTFAEWTNGGGKKA